MTEPQWKLQKPVSSAKRVACYWMLCDAPLSGNHNGKSSQPGRTGVFTHNTVNQCLTDQSPFNDSDIGGYGSTSNAVDHLETMCLCPE